MPSSSAFFLRSMIGVSPSVTALPDEAFSRRRCASLVGSTTTPGSSGAGLLQEGDLAAAAVADRKSGGGRGVALVAGAEDGLPRLLGRRRLHRAQGAGL